jgi:hypothetical protein
MAIELSNIIFTDQDDFVPLFGTEQIVNTGIANTLAGDDVITGIVTQDSGTGIYNIGTLNTGDGNDIVSGKGAGINSGIGNGGYIDTGDDNDVIIGINTGGDGNGITNSGGGIYGGTIDTGNGNDIIIGIAITSNLSSKGIYNSATINTGNGNDSIISQGNFANFGGVFLGEGNDWIIVGTDISYAGLSNYSNIIETGDGNDIISTDVIYNEDVINTGNGDDLIIANGGIPGSGYGIYNNGGTINTGNGNDSIIANEGFQSNFNNGGSVLLGDGEDYIRGFGNNDFYGGSGNDILELTPGSYTVGTGETSVTFTKSNQLMITSEFEQLIAGGTTYDFTSLTAGQIIIVA